MFKIFLLLMLFCNLGSLGEKSFSFDNKVSFKAAISDSQIAQLLEDFLQKAMMAFNSFKNMILKFITVMPDQTSKKSINLQLCLL
jgi:hypothetical protein